MPETIEINRETYDHYNEDRSLFKIAPGISEEYRIAIDHLTNLEILRHLETEQFELLLEDTINAAGGDITLQSSKLKPGWVYTITNLVAWVDGTSIAQVALGYVSAERFWIMKKRSAQNPFESVEYNGELVLKEGDRIQVTFFNTKATEKLYVYTNGYKRRI